MVRIATFLRHGLLAVLLAVSATPAPAAEVASAWAETEQTAVRFIAARDGLGADGIVRAGLEFKLKPGWKVYWRSPGDAGFPPHLEFAGSENAKAGALSWPTPHRFSVIGLETLGYEDSVVLPFTLTAERAFQPAKLSAKVRYLTCKDICIPYDADLTMEVPVGGGQPTALAHTIGKFESQVPRTPDLARLDVREVWAEASEKAVYVTAKAVSEIPLNNPDLYLEGPVGQGLGFGAPETRISEDGRSATMRVAVSGLTDAPTAAAEKLLSTPLILTLLDSGRAAEVSVTPGDIRPFTGTQPAKTSDASSAGNALPLMLLFAFLGGLILNLMPCVLPVLSIKFLSVIKHGGSTPAVVRNSFLMSAAGIVTAFLILAGALIALKSAGAAIGWGIQFQQPWFLIAMAFVVTLFACNLWGFFEVRLPAALTPGGRDDGRHGLGGHFLQGMLATLLATPCSAPFLGTAVGFALARGTGEIMAIFAALGIGLAAPYLLVAAVPRLAAMMPAPGPWMVKLKAVMGVALAGTAVWLLSVIAGVSGMGVAAVTAVVLLVMVGWIGYVIRIAPEMRKATAALLVLLSVGAVTNAYVADMDGPLDLDQPNVSKIAWAPFDPAVIPGLVESGKIVFVDVTADWCITCQVNKRLVLENARLLEVFNGVDVVAMQADWTRPNPEITAYLASFGRYGIPFNAIYGENAKLGNALPELLTEGVVLEAFRNAAPAHLAARFQ